MAPTPSFRLAELAELVGGSVVGDGERVLRGLRPLDTAGAEDLSFLTHPKYRALAAESAAGALLVGREVELAGRDLLVVEEPYLALSRLLAAFHPATPPAPGVHPTAVIAAGAVVDESASIGAYAVVEAGSSLGADVRLGPHVVVGRDCRIGEESVLHAGVVLYDGTWLGARCIVHSGVVLGSDGFGYAQHGGRHVKLPQVGRVVVEDDVEIGANSAIDRAMLDETRIGAGSKIDNLVQVAHNVRLGKGCLLISQSGIAGSTKLGDGVVLAGQSGTSGHLELGDGVRVAAKSAVFKSVEAGRQVAGSPAVDAAEWRRRQVLLGRLRELDRRVAALERRLAAGEEREDRE